jgi:hypothetical protein
VDRKIPVAFSVIGVIVLVAASGGGTACTTHQCDGGFQLYTGGHVVDANTYETNALDEPWLNYPGEQSYLIQYPDFGRPPLTVIPYVAIDPNANAPNEQWTVASGNLTEISIASSTQVFVHNDTCAGYYLRVVVLFPPVEAIDAGTATDGGADGGADAGTDGETETEGGTDGGTDGTTDGNPE